MLTPQIARFGLICALCLGMQTTSATDAVGQNLLWNPGFDDASQGGENALGVSQQWVVESGVWNGRHVSPSPSGNGNLQYLAPGIGQIGINTSIYQEVDLSDNGFDPFRLETGGYHADFGGLQHSYGWYYPGQPSIDSGQLSLRAADANGNQLLNHVLDPYGGDVWTARSATNVRLPADTDKLTFQFHGYDSYALGTDNTAFVDETELELGEYDIWTWGQNTADTATINDWFTNENLAIGNEAAGGLAITTGTVRIQESPASTAVFIGQGTGGSGTVIVDGANSALIVEYKAIILGRGDSGELTVSNGGQVTSEILSFLTSEDPGRVGSVLIDGAGSRFNGKDLFLDSGNFTLTVQNEGMAEFPGSPSVPRANIGGANVRVLDYGVLQFNSVDVSGNVLIDKGVMAVADQLRAGQYLNAEGITIQNQGALLATRSIIGTGSAYSVSSSAEIRVRDDPDGGTGPGFMHSTLATVLGETTDSEGILDIDGGRVFDGHHQNNQVTGEGFIVGKQGRGVVTVTNGGELYTLAGGYIGLAESVASAVTLGGQSPEQDPGHWDNGSLLVIGPQGQLTINPGSSLHNVALLTPTLPQPPMPPASQAGSSTLWESDRPDAATVNVTDIELQLIIDSEQFLPGGALLFGQASLAGLADAKATWHNEGSLWIGATDQDQGRYGLMLSDAVLSNADSLIGITALDDTVYSGRVLMTGATQWDNHGALSIVGTTSELPSVLTINDGQLNIGQGLANPDHDPADPVEPEWLLEPGGGLLLGEFGQLELLGGHIHAHHLEMQGGLLDWRGGDLQLDQQSISGAGEIMVGPQGLDLGNNGELAGSGAGLVLRGDLHGSGLVRLTTIFGDVFVGNSPGLLHMIDVDLIAGSTLFMEIAGTGMPGIDFDHVDFDGVIDLSDITLDLAQLGGFLPSAGDLFQLFDFSDADLGGSEFFQLLLPQLDTGLNWNTDTLYSDGTLAVVSDHMDGVPTPSAVWLIILGLGALIVTPCRWRTRPLS